MYYNEIDRRLRHMARLLTDTDSVFDEAERASDTLGRFITATQCPLDPMAGLWQGSMETSGQSRRTPSTPRTSR